MIDGLIVSYHDQAVYLRVSSRDGGI